MLDYETQSKMLQQSTEGQNGAPQWSQGRVRVKKLCSSILGDTRNISVSLTHLQFQQLVGWGN